MDNLKRCPFCGGEPYFVYNIEMEPDGIRCSNCHIVIRFPRIKVKGGEKFEVAMGKMAEIWNRRVNETTVNQYGENNHCITNVGTLYL